MLLWIPLLGRCKPDCFAEDLYPLVIVVKCYLYMTTILIAQ